MKKYIILTNDIFMLGGGQLYAFRKAEFVEKLGYKAYIFYYDKPHGSKIYIKYFEQFSDNYIKGLALPLHFVSKHKKIKMVGEIKKKIDYNDDDIIFESNTVTASEWCEFLAQKLKAKHLCYLLSESFSIRNPRIYDFLYYKYCQNQLFGTNEHSLLLLFSNYEDIKIVGRYLLAYSGSKVNCEYTKLPFDTANSDFKICIFGRLDKHFVIPTVKSLISYFRKNSDKYFSLIVVGGTDKKNELKPFEKLFKHEKNSSFYCTGPIYPVPENWLREMDVIIATAGSVSVAAKINSNVISICVQNDKPFGIYNYTTKSIRDICEDEKFEYDLDELLDMILKEHFCDKHSDLGCVRHTDENELMNNEFEYQLKLAEDSNIDGYFSFDHIKFNFSEWIRYRVDRFYKLRMLYHKIKLLLKK